MCVCMLYFWQLTMSYFFPISPPDSLPIPLHSLMISSTFCRPDLNVARLLEQSRAFKFEVRVAYVVIIAFFLMSPPLTGSS